jgi:hypothetical protein
MRVLAILGRLMLNDFANAIGIFIDMLTVIDVQNIKYEPILKVYADVGVPLLGSSSN